MRDYSGLDRALDRLAGDLYPDVAGRYEPHGAVINASIRKLKEMDVIKPNMQVLDVGAGAGLGTTMLGEAGCSVQGIDLKPEKSEVTAGDQSFMPFQWDDYFDLVWARHVLEHSVMPLYTLMEYRRVLKVGGYAYVEVPAPDTDAHHEANANHYSVLGVNAWGSLMTRLFTIVDTWEYRFQIPQSSGEPLKDKYWAFLLHKEKAS